MPQLFDKDLMCITSQYTQAMSDWRYILEGRLPDFEAAVQSQVAVEMGASMLSLLARSHPSIQSVRLGVCDTSRTATTT